MRKVYTYPRYVVTSFLVVAFSIGVFFAFRNAYIEILAGDIYENVAYVIDPSASRAFTYGERHLDARNPDLYDIKRAEYFFNLAAVQDPTIPYLYHELARIAFLEGHFSTALTRIDFQIDMHGDKNPNSYYVRGLIEGYMGDYGAAASDYGHFLQFDPQDWAALNDYAWVLLKEEKFQKAADITARGLVDFPENPWLLNSRATALYELGEYEEALATVRHASVAVASLTDAQWSHAYPGNDPLIAADGVASFKKAVADNIHSIELAVASSTVQSNVNHE